MVSMVSVSLSAWDQIQESQTTSRKRMWALSLTLASILALYQSADVFAAFFEFPVSESETMGLIKSDFAFTICLGNPSIYKDIDDIGRDILLKMKSLNPTCNMTSPSLFCLSLLTDRERYYIGNDLYENIFPGPETEPYSNHVEYRVFNNLYYGNCVSRELDVNIPSFQGTVKIFSERNPPVLVVHAKGTPPVFQPNHINVIKAKKVDVLVEYMSVDFQDLAWPYNKICEEDAGTIHSWTNLYAAYNFNSSTYEFSTESCLDQCVNDLTMEYCKCITRHSMLKRNQHKLPICSRICNKIPQSQFDAACNCKTPCHSAQFKLQSESLDPYQFEQSLLVKALAMKDLDGDYVYVEGEDDVENVFEEIKSNVSGGLISVVTIYKNFILKTKIKTPLLKLEDVYSVIGGIWGLWIGLSFSILFSMLIEAILKLSPAALVNSCDNLMTFLMNAMKYFGLIAIAAAFIWQNYVIIQQFYKYNVMNVETTEFQNSSSFPPVYVCPGTDLYLKNIYSKKDTHFSEKTRKFIQFYETTKERSPKHLDLEYVHLNFKYEEKLLLVPNVEEFVLDCEFRTETGSRIPCELESFSYILKKDALTCAIINPRKSFKDDESIRFTDLNVRLAFPRDNFSDYELKTNVGLQPFLIYKTDQNFDNAFWNAFDVEPGDLADVTYTLTETRRLPAPYASKCIDENTKYVKRKTMGDRYYQTMKYHYTYMACLRLCLETFDVVSEEIVESCQCQQPCNENKYDVKVNQKKYASKQRPKANQFNNITALFNYLWNGTAVVHIGRQFPTKKVISEKPVIDSFSLVGMIGGISGLWLGQCIISLVVELHLMLTIVVAKLKR